MKHRIVSLDCGRKFFTKKWILSLLNFMGELGFNQLNMHFSENQGYRIESRKYPQIVSELHYSWDDVKEIIVHAKSNGIEVVPEFDMPGHLEQVLNQFPHFRLANTGENDPTGFKNGAVDITNPDAVALLQDIMLEHFELFKDSKYFQLGADEYVHFEEIKTHHPHLLEYAKTHYGEKATGLEPYVAFTNEMSKYVKNHGYIPRVWNDGFLRKDQKNLVELDKDIEICFWAKYGSIAPASAFAEKGYKLINFNFEYFYYILTNWVEYNNPKQGAGYTFPSAHKIYSSFVYNKFAGEEILDEKYKQQILGVAFSIWCDVPERQSEREIFERIQEPMRALAAVL